MICSPFPVQLQVWGFFYSMLFECHHLCSGKRSEGYALRRSSLKYNTRDGTETSSAQNLISLNNLETDEQREQLGEIEVEGQCRDSNVCWGVGQQCVFGWVSGGSSVCWGGVSSVCLGGWVGGVVCVGGWVSSVCLGGWVGGVECVGGWVSSVCLGGWVDQ